MKMKIKLKRGYDIEIENLVINVEVGGVEVYYLGSYSKSQYGQTSIVDPIGIAPTYTGNHGEVIAIIERVKDE